MAKSSARRTRSPAISKTTRGSGRSKRKQPTRNETFGGFARHATLALLELAGFVVLVALTVAVVLGYTATWFSGTDLLAHLLPFTIGVVVLLLVLAFFVLAWWKIRRPLKAMAMLLPPICSLGAAIFAAWTVSQGDMAPAFDQFRMLVGGKEAVRRVTLAHQVFAAYRRYGADELQRMVERGQAYLADIDAAAESFGIDADLLLGVAAAESSFRPRDSRDGGRGLFQLTRVPDVAMQQAGIRLAVRTPSVRIARHNAFIAAATLNYYMQEMDNDLFLGLLAYNIGPRNGGLRFIMDRYGVDDFTTIQPYLKQLPRDYPIRVLSYALAFRIWRQQGRVLAYEKAGNAQRIQNIGIPGLYKSVL
ncbi:MAG: transglycosylase SLT domain-containing protein [Gammaproteobacteria bacterium]